MLYQWQVIEHHRGWTFVTLFDRVDHDWSWCAKPGIYNDHDSFEKSAWIEGKATCGTGCKSRDAARAAAKEYIAGNAVDARSSV